MKQEVGVQGNIAVDCTGGKPVGLFKEYLDDPVRTKATMLGNYYITGDKGYKDKDGYIWFDSRSDDVIISAGYALSRSLRLNMQIRQKNHNKIIFYIICLQN